MDRQIVYPGAIPLETDLLKTNKFAMMGLAKLAATMMGSNTYLHGLACTPSSPASMVVNVAKGQIYSLQNVDGTAYSSLAADTSNVILKQGVTLNATSFTLSAPTTAGQSINYLIQVAYNETDSGATVLPYYNATNPSVAYSGPNNSGTAQNTVRSGVCTVALKTGVAATTGTQTTPTADDGYTAAWVITVAQGSTAIAAANIAVATNAPFLPSSGVFSAIQQGTMTFAADSGAANAYAASFVPALPAIVDGVRVTFKAKVANTGASTLAVNSGAAFPVYSHAHQVLQGGEIIANGLIEVEWNSTLSAWVLCGNSGGTLPVSPATQSNQAVNLGQLMSRALNIARYTASGSFTVPAGVSTIHLSGCAAGGGGGSGATNNGGQSSLVGGGGGGGGGAGQSIIKQAYSVTPGQVISITVGSAGNGGQASGAGGGYNGNNGGNTSVSGLITLAGGTGGYAGGVVGSNAAGGGGAGGYGGEGYPAGSSGSDGNYAGNGGSGAGGMFGGGGGGARAIKTNPTDNHLLGQPAYGYGSGGGGSGGAYGSNSAVTSYAAGNGAPGIMIVEW